MAAPQGLTPEFATGFRHLMLDGLMRELETTMKVLKAVPDAKSDYRPDPHARTAWELHVPRASLVAGCAMDFVER